MSNFPKFSVLIIFILLLKVDPFAAAKQTRSLTKHLVSLRRPNEEFFGKEYFCAGTIISPKYIITAWHCVQIHPYYLRVVTGTPKRLEKTSTTRELSVINVERHPDYNATGRNENDIALLELGKEIIEDGTTTQRIAMVQKAPEPNSTCTTVGWGRIVYNGPLSDDALYVNQRVWSQNKCQKLGPHWVAGMMCAASENNDYRETSCEGDPGGPLICKNELAGIVSTGFKCELTAAPTIFTNISHYRDWISAELTGTRMLMRNSGSIGLGSRPLYVHFPFLTVWMFFKQIL